MVAAYRRFCDDLLSRRYMKTAQVIQSVDPYHPISVRSGFGGTGTDAPWALPQMPVDLFSGAKHLLYISPEGYNFSGSADNPEIRVVEYGGLVATGALDGSICSASGNSSTSSTGNFTTLHAHDLLVGINVSTLPDSERYATRGW